MNTHPDQELSELVSDENGTTDTTTSTSSSGTAVNLQRAASPLTREVALWAYIRDRTNALSFNAYQEVMDAIVCGNAPGPYTVAGQSQSNMRLPFPGVDRYTLLKTATEVFLMQNCGVALSDSLSLDATTLQDENARISPNSLDAAGWADQWSGYVTSTDGGLSTLPYLNLVRLKLKDLPLSAGDGTDIAECYGILEEKLTRPCLLELIWSYWHEESLLVQTMNALSLRFQNRRNGPGNDPLAHLELDPLRPLNNILWGYIQDEQHRLGIERRAYEYDHHYGITLHGRAVPQVKGADSRSKFLEAFHNLLHVCAGFFKQDDDTTVVSDAFPVLNSIKETHLILTQGAHNQYGDLPWTARMEMLMEQWLLARPEIREFLPGRLMVAYPEQWMDRVEVMKKFQGWDDTSVVHFRDLGVFGEQILLSIRFHNWSQMFDSNVAKNWARYWRAEIQGYLHAYRAVTGVDLAAGKPDATMPSVHLRRRLAARQNGAATRAAGRTARRAIP